MNQAAINRLKAAAADTRRVVYAESRLPESNQLPAQIDSYLAPNQRPDQLSPQSHSFSRSYETNLPTSLTYIILSDQRLLTLET